MDNIKQLKDGYLVPCKIHVFSNVDIKGVNCKKFDSMKQLVEWTTYAKTHPWEYAYFLIDEASSCMNSRSFTSNLNALTINSLLVCRHSNCSLIYTSQRYCLVDKLLRDVTSLVYQCGKIWRLNRVDVYDGCTLNQVADYRSVKPLRKTCTYLGRNAFEHYDTKALINLIEKSVKENDLLSPEEISNNIDSNTIPSVSEKHFKKAYRRATK